MKCTNCDREILRKLDCRSVNHFCSMSCSASYNNKKRKLTKEWKNKISRKLGGDGANAIKCARCGMEFKRHKRKQRFCSHKCSEKARRKYLDIPDCLENADRKLDKNLGYVRVYVPMHPEANTWGYVYEHRVIAEQMMGRRLKGDEVVHHKNGKRWDNREENLEVMDRFEHSKISGSA